MKEQVKHPTHYNKGIEMWEYSYSHNLDFFEGNVVKYRYPMETEEWITGSL